MNCCFCGKEVESVEQAVELGWYPDFWQGDVNYQGPVCPECQTEHLFTDADGEYVLKPDHSLPPMAVRMGVEEIRKEKPMVAKPKFQLGQILATPGALEGVGGGRSDARFLPGKTRCRAIGERSTTKTSGERPGVGRRLAHPVGVPDAQGRADLDHHRGGGRRGQALRDDLACRQNIERSFHSEKPTMTSKPCRNSRFTGPPWEHTS